MARLTQLMAVALLVIVLAGCAAPGAPQPVATVTTSSNPGPTPTATAAAEPVLPFSGDCAAALSADQLDDVLGTGWIDGSTQLAEWAPSGQLWPELNPWGTIGGLECSWFAAEGADLPEGIGNIAVLIAPASEIPSGFTADYATARCEPDYDSSSCRLSRVDGDTWLMARAGWSATEPPVELLTAVLDGVARNATEAAQPQRSGITADWWPLSSCEELTKRAGLTEAIGPFVNGYWEGSEQPEQALESAVGVGQVCPWFTDGEQISTDDPFYIGSIHLAPGGAWQWDALASTDGATPMDVSGALHAIVYRQSAATDSAVLFATDGVNVASVGTTATDSVLADIASRVIGALSSG